MSSGDEKRRRRIYSRRGDLGETSLFSGPRVGKDQKRIVAVGTLDELVAFLGLARAEGLRPEIDAEIDAIQRKLGEIGTEIVAMTPAKHEVATVGAEDIQRLEEMIDRWEKTLPPLDHFLIPGESGGKSAALLHVTRTICRRVERRLVALVRADANVNKKLLGWINRLGDLLFVLARAEDDVR